MHHHSASTCKRDYPPLTIDRRTILKASAAFASMAAVGGALPKSTVAQSSDGTVAGEFHAPVGQAASSFTADFPFHAIAPHWSGNLDFPAAVELRVSGDGSAFSDAFVIGPAHADAGPMDNGGRTFGELVFTQEAQVVQYRGVDANGNDAEIPDLSFTYLNSSSGPSLEDITTASPTPGLDRPPIISRNEWGAALAYGGADRGELSWTPEYQTVQHVIIHHSETPSFRDPVAEIRSIHYYHAITRGWGDIGYNYLVDFMGNVYEGRAGGENVVGGHAYQYAYGSAGICSMGSFKETGPTPECIAGLTWISAWCARNLDPLGRSDFHEQPNLPTICGHRDVNDSTCPGDGLYADLPIVRSAVAEVIAGSRDALLDPEYSPGEIVETTSDGVNARWLPGLDGDVVTSLPTGSIMEVVDGPTTVDDYHWYKLNGENGFGWVAAEMFTPSAAMAPQGRFVVGDELVVNTDVVNIRYDTTIRTPAVASVPFGTAGLVINGPRPDGGYRWYELETDYGTGWAVEQYLARPGEETPETQFLIGDTVAVDDPDGVRLRSGAGTSFDRITSLSPGDLGKVVDGPIFGDGFTWMEIQTNAGSGWAAQDFFTLSEAEAPAGDGQFDRGDAIVVNTDSLNVREFAGIDGPVIVQLGYGVTGQVIDGPNQAAGYNWYRIETNEVTGWAVESFLALNDGSAAGPAPSIGATVYVNTDGINLRDSASTSGTVVAVLFTNETGTVLDGPVEADGYSWLQLETASGTGWGAAQYLGTGSPDPVNNRRLAIQDRVSVNTDGINLRTAPSVEGDVVAILLQGAEATILDGPRQADGYTWFQLESDQGTGWAVDNYLELVDASSASIGDTLRVTGGELNLRAGAGTDEALIAILPDGAYVEVVAESEDADGYTWLRVQSSSYGTGWAASDFLAAS